jgi:hypothetical protein
MIIEEMARSHFSFSNASLTGLVDRRTGWDSLESAIAEDIQQ